MNETAATTAGTVAGVTGITLVVALLIFALVGLAIGALARWILPGRDDMSLPRTMLYGVGGSMLGGIVSRLLGINMFILDLAIAVAVAVGLIWFFTRRKKA
jgi:uncharacterized membrane protein YeaQ/YmgE (transglycosylase-associated protein family)